MWLVTFLYGIHVRNKKPRTPFYFSYCTATLYDRGVSKEEKNTKYCG